MRKLLLIVPLLLLPLAIATAPVASASCSGGGSDAPAAAAAPATADAFAPPGPPENLTATAGNQNVVLQWNSPDNDGGGVDFYRVYVNGQPTLTTTQTQVQVNGLTNGQTYTFNVTANNDCGESPFSNDAMATPHAGQDVELIGRGNLTMSTGVTNLPTPSDPFIGKQTFPRGTNGIGMLEEQSDAGFCNGPCLAGQVLVNSLDGTLGGPTYSVFVLYDDKIVPTNGTAGFIVWYDPVKGQNPIVLGSCTSSPPPCVVSLTRPKEDLKVQVRTPDLDPRIGTSR